MGVADLRPRVPIVLAIGLFRAFHQPTVRHEVLHPREAVDVMDLVEEHQRQDLADPRHRAQPIEGVYIVHLGGFAQVQLELTEESIVLVDQGQVRLDALTDLGVAKPLGQPPAVAVVRDLAEGGQEVLTGGVLDM
jgi:hypothetical protein